MPGPKSNHFFAFWSISPHLSSKLNGLIPNPMSLTRPTNSLLVYDACRGKLRSIVLDEATFIELQLLAVLVLCLQQGTRLHLNLTGLLPKARVTR
ncbi:hypothetical protein [Shinella zoogloeoides]|uniref:hypothetical protein n=1 Tax=Shinella zoogloeoides TaxID=352475 RepID=UPI00299E6459|nr:hypothetical protein [Shinella zoogloeoides]